MCIPVFMFIAILVILAAALIVCVIFTERQDRLDNADASCVFPPADTVSHS